MSTAFQAGSVYEVSCDFMGIQHVIGGRQAACMMYLVNSNFKGTMAATGPGDGLKMRWQGPLINGQGVVPHYSKV